MSILSEVENENTPTGMDGGADPDFSRLKGMVLSGQRYRGPWVKKAVSWYDMVANHQWSETDKQLLESQNRPVVSFNRVAPIIKAVCGLEVNNRQGIVYLPREPGDVGPDQAYTGAAKWVREECMAEDEESEAFRDMVISGEGWTETRMSYDDDPQGKIVKERINPIEMGVNDGACRANYTDSRIRYRVRQIDSLEAEALFEGRYTTDQLHASWISDLPTPQDGGEGNKKDYPSETRDALKREAGKLTKIKIVHVQWWERKQVYMVADETEELKELTKEQFDTANERAKLVTGADLQHAVVGKKCFYTAYLTGSALIEKKELTTGQFTFGVMTGERDTRDNCFYGMVHDMMDPQRWANKWLAQTMNIMNTNAKGGLMAETDAFVNVRKAQRDWSDPTKIVWVKPGSISKNKVKERTPPPMPSGLGELMNFALSSLRDVTGVNLELMGQADREQAASLELQRRQAAMTILATMFDSLRRYRKHEGRLLLQFIQMLPDKTLVRVLEKGQAKYVPLIKSDDVAKFDIIIDEAPQSPDQKALMWQMTLQLLQQGLELPPAVIIKLMKFSPYPESVVQEIADAMGLGNQEPPEVVAQKLQQAEQALQVLTQELQAAKQEVEDKEADRAIERARAETEQYKAETERLNVGAIAAGGAEQREQDLAIEALTAATQPPAGAQGEGAQTPQTPDLNPDKIAEIMALLQQLVAGQAPAPEPQSFEPAEEGM